MLTVYDLEHLRPHSNHFAHGVGIPAGARLLVSNGQIGERADGTTPEDAATQTEVIFERLEAILAADGMALTDIARLTTFLTEVEYQVDYKRVRDRIMGDHKPANTVVIVKDLVRVPLKVEVEMIAAKAD